MIACKTQERQQENVKMIHFISFYGWKLQIKLRAIKFIHQTSERASERASERNEFLVDFLPRPLSASMLNPATCRRMKTTRIMKEEKREKKKFVENNNCINLMLNERAKMLHFECFIETHQELGRWRQWKTREKEDFSMRLLLMSI